jgi:L-lactate dehydrogenase complex protein LldE
VGDRPFRLLEKVRGLELVPLANLERCCGFGGTFSVKNADVSTAILDENLIDVLATDAEYCTALDNSCLMHLGGALHRQKKSLQTIHIAGILASTKEDPHGATA